MTALTKNRDTKVHEIVHLDWLPVAAGAHLYAGSLIAINAAGYAVPATTSTAIVAAGRAEEECDNTLGAAGDRKVNVRRGIFLFANSAGGDAIAIADRYKSVFVVDDQTVAKTSATGTRARCGRVANVEPAGVWVHIDPLRDGVEGT